MIGDKIEKNIIKNHKNKTQLIVSIVVIFVVIILFAVFMRLDFSKPAPVSQEQEPSLTPQERGAIIDEATKDMEFSTTEERSASVSDVNIKYNQEARMRAVNNQ